MAANPPGLEERTSTRYMSRGMASYYEALSRQTAHDPIGKSLAKFQEAASLLEWELNGDLPIQKKVELLEALVNSYNKLLVEAGLPDDCRSLKLPHDNVYYFDRLTATKEMLSRLKTYQV